MTQDPWRIASEQGVMKSPASKGRVVLAGKRPRESKHSRRGPRSPGGPRTLDAKGVS